MSVLDQGRRSTALTQFCSSLPVSWPPMIFCKDNTNIWFFWRFQIVEKIGKFVVSIERLKTKSTPALGGFVSRSPDQGLCRWGLCPQTPVIGLRYRARHGAMTPPQMLQARTATVNGNLGYLTPFSRVLAVFFRRAIAAARRFDQPVRAKDDIIISQYCSWLSVPTYVRSG